MAQPTDSHSSLPPGMINTECAERDGLRQAAAQFHAIFNNANEGIICIDSNGVITLANRASEMIFGYPPHYLIGRNISCLMPLPHRTRHMSYITRYLETGERKIIGLTREVIGLHRNGSEIPIELTVVEVMVNGTRSFTGIFSDISERKAALRLLKQREEEIQQTREHLAHMERLHIATEMSAAIAHEVNQPLTAIGLYAQSCKRLIENGQADRETLLTSLARIDAQAQRAGKVISGLRSLGQRQKTQHRRTDINTLIEATVDLARIDIDHGEISLTCQLAPELPLVEIMETQIQQVLLNLIRNARDALKNESALAAKQILISSAPYSNKFIKIIVRDNGPGIRETNAEKIFQPFFSNKKLGMGLGLTISRTIIESHGGQLALNVSYRPGAEFYFTLPVSNR